MGKRSYRSDFEAMIKKNGTQVYDHLSDVMPDAAIRLSKGDFKKVVNGYGCVIGPFEILGFSQPDSTGCCIYLNWDCYWYKEPVNKVVMDDL